MDQDGFDESAEDETRQDSQLDGAIPGSPSPHPSAAHERKHAQQKGLGPPTARANGTRATELRSNTSKSNVTSWLEVPAPLKRLFDRFPLLTYAENELPTRAFRKRVGNVLYVFTSHNDAMSQRPSFNPSCLKWQTYLKMAGISFRTIPSNNHASPSGSLPFLLSHTTSIQAYSNSVPEVVLGSRLKKWSRERLDASNMQESDDVRYEAYSSLLDNRIRKAWLYQLYLHPANEAMVNRLYVKPCSSNLFVQMALAAQLRLAAESEIIKASAKSGGTTRIDEKEVMQDAEEAFGALSALLGNNSWFFRNGTRQQSHETTRDDPSLFDASVFAYTNLILDSTGGDNEPIMRWTDSSLKVILERYENLVRHRDRILEMYY